MEFRFRRGIAHTIAFGGISFEIIRYFPYSIRARRGTGGCPPCGCKFGRAPSWRIFEVQDGSLCWVLSKARPSPPFPAPFPDKFWPLDRTKSVGRHPGLRTAPPADHRSDRDSSPTRRFLTRPRSSAVACSASSGCADRGSSQFRSFRPFTHRPAAKRKTGIGFDAGLWMPVSPASVEMTAGILSRCMDWHLSGAPPNNRTRSGPASGGSDGLQNGITPMTASDSNRFRCRCSGCPPPRA